MESLIAGRFEVLAPVRSGAMGEVVKARDHAPGEGQASDIVAVKRILCRRDGAPLSVSVGDELVQRFVREVRIMEKVSSPHLPAMIAGGVEGGTDDRVDGGVPYFAMEFIDGDNVKDLVGEAGRLPVAWAAAIGVQAARGLEAVHRASVVHRDVKPANIMLARDGRVRVVDFGIGLILDDSEDDAGRITGTGVTLGTARYMAPEQAVLGPVTAAADVYALGCVLFELLTGAAPFDGATTFEVLDQHRHQAPTPVRTLRSDVPEELAAVGGPAAREEARGPSHRGGGRGAATGASPGVRPRRGGRLGQPRHLAATRRATAGGRDAASSGDRAGSGQAGMRTGAGRQADGPGQDQTAGAGQEASGHAGDTRGRGLRHLHRPRATDQRLRGVHQGIAADPGRHHREVPGGRSRQQVTVARPVLVIEPVVPGGDGHRTTRLPCAPDGAVWARSRRAPGSPGPGAPGPVVPGSLPPRAA